LTKPDPNKAKPPPALRVTSYVERADGSITLTAIGNSSGAPTSKKWKEGGITFIEEDGKLIWRAPE
jgi:hypothetical protein